MTAVAETLETRTGKDSFTIPPVDDLTLSAARFVVSMRVIEDSARHDLANVDDLGSLDFFATHPLIVFGPGSDVHAELRLHGFPETPDYLQPGAIHAGHLEMARVVVALLLGKRCIEAKVDKALTWVLTSQGRAISEQLTGEYFAGHAFALNGILDLVPKQCTRWKELRISWLNNTPRCTTV
jgi:hypothetical protein